MVNVEADVLCGKYLSDLAKKNNVIYSMAYGDQPALIMEQIEWAKLNGFLVVGAGKGTKYHPSFEYSTPDTVWKNYGMTDEEASALLGIPHGGLSYWVAVIRECFEEAGVLLARPADGQRAGRGGPRHHSHPDRTAGAARPEGHVPHQRDDRTLAPPCTAGVDPAHAARQAHAHRRGHAQGDAGRIRRARLERPPHHLDAARCAS